jgi:hypothetical protein
MKKFLYAFIMLSFFLFSCGGGGEQKTEASDEAVETEQSDEVTDAGDQEIKDCDDFLDRYDEWSDEYLKVMKSWKENPADPEVGEKYMELSEDMGEWYTDWTNYMQCASSEKYQKRFEEIAEKIDKGLEELGFKE